MKGNINSIETMGLVDGPGVRVVVFFQGCSLRCLFCHNPETWSIEKKNFFTVDELFEKIIRYRSYFGKKGGVTFSGGEPLLQPNFLKEILKKCKENGIHTAIDTAGYGLGNYTDYADILKYTDLVIFDIKALDPKEYKKMTGKNIDESLKFLDLCQEKGKELWIRQVIVPTINDDLKYVKSLKEFVKSLKNVSRVELLPYRTLGNSKYDALNIKYRLKGIPDMDDEKLKTLQNILESNS